VREREKGRDEVGGMEEEESGKERRVEKEGEEGWEEERREEGDMEYYLFHAGSRMLNIITSYWSF
jgi:hypothetical protein